MLLLLTLMFFKFRVHGKDNTTEIKFDIAKQIKLDHVLAQRSRQSTTWTAQLSNINKYIYINATQSRKFQKILY